MNSSYNRRKFLAYASRAALVQVPWLVGCASQRSHTDDVAPWKELSEHLEGPLLRPGAWHFNSLTTTWNLRYASARPAALARCKTIDDIRVCLQWAQANKVPMVARSGGHSYAGYSTTPGLMIDLSLLDSIQFNPSTQEATVGAGARNATLYANLPAVGRSVTHGRCEQVGVGGLVLGGGIGFNMRAHGLLIDQLAETELMTADGKVLRCNAKENADVFWACRGGGGGNFGINTLFRFRTFPVGKITAFKLTWTDKVDDVLAAALDILPAAPREFGCKLSIVQKAGEPLTVALLGQLVGGCQQLARVLAPLYRLSCPATTDIQHKDYWDLQPTFLGESGDREYSHERSRYVFQPISSMGVRTILDYMRRWPGTSAQTTWKAFLAGGAISDVPSSETAYCHRKAIIVSSVELNWLKRDIGERLQKNEAWLTAFHDAMAEFTSAQSYQNFIDDSQRHYLRAYYGENLERLVQVKRKVDPANVFHYRQSIPLAL